MREYVEIGIGREARKAYDLDDLTLVPTRRTRSSKDVNTEWHIDAYSFDMPLVSHPTDALASPEFAIEMGKQGGLAVLNAEGILGRHANFEEAINEVCGQAPTPKDLEPENYHEIPSKIAKATATLQKLHQAPIDLDVLSERIAQVRASGATVAVRVSPQNVRELAPAVIKAGAEILFVQGTLISAEHVQPGGEPLNLKEFIGSLDVPVIAGGVFDYTTATHLMRAGAAGVIVGSGRSSSGLALDVPLATAIADVAAARRDYLDETGGRYAHVIADSAPSNAGDIALALAMGADAVMVGDLLAKANEAAAGGAYWEPASAHPRFPRGEVANWGLGERLPLSEILFGPSSDSGAATNLVGGLRRIMAKCGYTDLKSFQKVDVTVRP